MNHPTLNKLALACACVAGAALLSACGGSSSTSPGSSTTVTPVSPLDSQVRYQVMLVDGVTGDTITDSLSVTFTGDATLKDSLGTSLNGKTVTTTNGLVALGATFSAAAKSFSIQAGNRARGWIETGTAVVAGTADSGDKQIIIKLFNTGSGKVSALNSSTLPVAMAVGEVTTDSSGKLSTDVVLATTTKTVTNAEGATESMGVSTLKLTSGTIGNAADGSIATGKLTVAATTFSNVNAQSMSAFPGGFAANVTNAPADVLGSASATNGAFVTGGFAQFNVTDSAGKAIKTFDKPVAITIDLPKSSKKLDGTAFKVGDTYPIWSYDDTTGRWAFEQNGIIQDKSPVDANFYQVAFETRHLSSWNLDLYGDTCTAQLNLTGRPSGDARPLEVEIVGVSGQRFSRTVYPTDSQVTLYRMLTGTSVNITVRDEGTPVGRLENVQLCTASPVSLPLTLPTSSTGAVRVEVSESCANGTGKTPLPTFTWLNRGRHWNSGYARAATASATAASYDFASVRPGEGTVWVENPRATSWHNRYTSKPVTVTSGSTATVSFNFTKTCPTGATGAGN